MPYWIAYVLIVVAAWAFKNPLWVLALPVAWQLSRWIPDPAAALRALHDERTLRDRVAAHPGDLAARRSLARVLVHTRRPAAAVTLLEEAIAKGLDDDEAFFLLGLARLRSGRTHDALAPLVRSVEKHEKLLFGEPYFVAAEALARLGRLEAADDALERGLSVHASNIGARVRLAEIRRARGLRAEARRTYDDALRIWSELPDPLKWPATGAALRAWLGRLRP